MDTLGRVVIPKAMRKRFDMEPGVTSVDLSMSEDGILLAPHKETCIFCGGNKDLKVFHNKPVCAKCHADIRLLGEKDA